MGQQKLIYSGMVEAETLGQALPSLASLGPDIYLKTLSNVRDRKNSPRCKYR